MRGKSIAAMAIVRFVWVTPTDRDLAIQAMMTEHRLAMTSSAVCTDSTGDLKIVDLENVRLLVVEAEPEAQAAIVAILQDCGAEVVAVSSVKAGLVAVDQQHPDVLISDLYLPDGDGCSLMQTVREREAIHNMRAIPAIAISEYAKTIDLDALITAGFKRYLSKPIQAGRLISLVAWLTDRAQDLNQNN